MQSYAVTKAKVEHLGALALLHHIDAAVEAGLPHFERLAQPAAREMQLESTKHATPVGLGQHHTQVRVNAVVFGVHADGLAQPELLLFGVLCSQQCRNSIGQCTSTSSSVVA